MTTPFDLTPRIPNVPKVITVRGRSLSQTQQYVRLNTTEGLMDLPATPLAGQKSPGGYAWGYAGSGPAALAHSLLAFMFSFRVADQLYQDFKDAFFTNAPANFEYTAEEITAWVDAHFK